jgi:hypothetical protein
MPLNRNLIAALAPDYLLERIEGEITVYHPTLATSLYLNETGALIWELCDGKRSISEIIDMLSELYPESREQIDEGVIGVINSLVANNIATLNQRTC